MKRGDIFVLGEGYDGYYGVSPQSTSIAVATGAEARIDFGDFTRRSCAALPRCLSAHFHLV
jgi:hypothetical protein